MEQHPIPRQITTFEFKLIGFLTLKQFIYLLVFFVFGFVSYLLTPIPFLNYLVGIAIGSIGLAFAFLPINDRPMDIWVKNFIKRLTSPTQYTFKKQNRPPEILLDIVKNSSYVLSNYIDSQQKLNSYLSTRNQYQTDSRKQKIAKIISQKDNDFFNYPKENKSLKEESFANKKTSQSQSLTFSFKDSKGGLVRKPFISGVIRNYKNTPLAGILIYIKKEGEENPIRILKTNSHGVFLSFNPFPSGDYILEIKDPKQLYFFDTMKLRVENEDNKPIEIKSKEMI